jgi:CheY-like chemotaxis protein
LYKKNDVDLACEGLQGYQQLTSNQYHLAIIDWDMPGMAGPEIGRRFRAEGGSTPILLLMGRADENDKKSGLDSGADDYLTKPFSINELGARMRSLLRRSNPLSSAAEPALAQSPMRACTGCGRKHAGKDKVERGTADGSSAVPLSDSELEVLVLSNRFQIDGILGLGAWSEVYRGKDLETGSVVAIKILHKHMCLDPIKIERYAYPVTSGRTPKIQCTRGAQPFLLLLASVGFDARFPDQTG